MLDANRSRVGVLRSAGNLVGEVVDEPYEQGIRSFGAGRPGTHRGYLELSAGYHVAFACQCSACRAARFLARSDVTSTPAGPSPTSLAAREVTVRIWRTESVTLVLVAAAHVGKHATRSQAGAAAAPKRTTECGRPRVRAHAVLVT